MSLSMYQASAPMFVRALGNLAHVLRNGEAFARERGAEVDAMLQSRMIYDMLPLTRQVQIATDMATRGTARLAGVEPMSFEENETSFAELYARIERAVEYLNSFQPAQIDGSEEREIHLKMRTGEMHFNGQDYLLGFVVPNLYFHCTTAYNLLRESGVRIGKQDFMGA